MNGPGLISGRKISSKISQPDVAKFGKDAEKEVNISFTSTSGWRRPKILPNKS